MLTVKNLSFSYDKKPILQDVSFTLEKGEVGVLLGANGIGKSTLIKILAGVLKNKSGEIELLGKNSTAYKKGEYARLVSYVPQNPTFSGASVLDAVLIGRLPLFTAPSKKDFERAYQAIENVGISHLAMKNTQKLSGGEKQKVAIARALCGDADLLLLDEPTSDLDIKSRYDVLGMMRELSKLGKTLLITMHDVNDALEIGNKFIVLSQSGAIVGDKNILTEELFHDIFGLHLVKAEHGGHAHFHLNEHSHGHFHVDGSYHKHDHPHGEKSHVHDENSSDDRETDRDGE